MKYISLPVPEEFKSVFRGVVLGDDGSVNVAWAENRIIGEIAIGNDATGESQQLLWNPIFGSALFAKTRAP